MNLSVHHLDLSSISEETKALYSFPADRLQELAEVQRGVPRGWQQESIDYAFLTTAKIGSAALLFGMGSAFYILHMLPGGVAIRLHLDKQRSFAQRWTRRTLPFACFFLPFAFLRQVARLEHDYKK